MTTTFSANFGTNTGYSTTNNVVTLNGTGLTINGDGVATQLAVTPSFLDLTTDTITNVPILNMAATQANADQVIMTTAEYNGFTSFLSDSGSGIAFSTAGNINMNPGISVYQMAAGNNVVNVNNVHAVDSFIEGGATGSTTVVFDGNIANYTQVGFLNSTLTVTDNVGNDGTVVLRNVTSAQFADVTVPLTNVVFSALEVNPYAALAQELYLGFLGRPGDPAGLTALTATLSALSNNVPSTMQGVAAAETTNPVIANVLNSFVNSAEFQTLYGNDTPTQLVTAVYENALGRAPDAGGLAFWVNALTTGQVTTAQIVANIVAGGMNDADSLAINERVVVATNFTNLLVTHADTAAYSGMTATMAGQALMNGVGANATTLASEVMALSTLNSLVNGGPVISLVGMPQVNHSMIHIA